MSDDGFELAQDGRRRFFTYDHLDDLEQSEGLRRFWGQGLVLGFLGGAILKAGVDGSWGCLVDSDGPHCTNDEKRKVMSWGGAGAALGAGVGAFIKVEAWSSSLLGSAKTSFRPIVAPRLGPEGRGALFLGARVRF